MQKTHITSLLRPRGRYKSIEDQQQERPITSGSNNESQQLELTTSPTTSKTNFELIPTLTFVINQPITTNFEQLQHVAATCASNNIDEDDLNSNHTYIIESPTTTAIVATSSAATDDESLPQQQRQEQQEVDDDYNFSLSLTDNTQTASASASSFVDEPTSSISIEMDNLATTTTATTTDGVAPTTTSTRNSNRSAMTTITTPASSDEPASIEEDIEEAIEISEELDENSLDFSEAAGNTKTTTSVSKKHHQLFGIELDEPADGDSRSERLKKESFKSANISENNSRSERVKENNSKSGKKSVSDDEDFKFDFDNKPKPTVSKKHHNLFGIDDLEESDNKDSESERVKEESSLRSEEQKSASNADEQFKIDDEQLSGGQLAQHFVLDDDEDDVDDEDEDDEDDEDDDLDDLDVSLPMDNKPLVHSRHDDAASVAGGNDQETHKSNEREESLTNQSTADDISDFVDEPQLNVDEAEKSSLELEMNMAGRTQNSEEELQTLLNERELNINIEKQKKREREDEKAHKSEEPSCHSSKANNDFKMESQDKTCVEDKSETQKSTSNHSTKQESNQKEDKSETQKSTNNHSTKQESNQKEERHTFGILLGASPEHSEKDHSIEELVETNHSIEMTLDDKDLSSLNASFDLHNETLVNRLLGDTIEEDKDEEAKTQAPRQLFGESSSSLQTTKPEKKEMILPNKSDNNSLGQVLKNRETFEDNFSSQRMVTDLDDSTDVEQVEVVETSATQESLENLGATLNEAKLIENKTIKSLETLQLQATRALPVETIVLEPLRAERSQSTSPAEIRHFETYENPHQRPPISTPELRELLAHDDDDEDNSIELMKLRILAMKLQANPNNASPTEALTSAAIEAANIKQMERVPLNDFGKEVLEDITEESERNSLSTAEEQQSLSLERSECQTLQTAAAAAVEVDSSASAVSLNMIQMLEAKVGELKQMLASKDACLASLNLQLEVSQQRRESSSGAVSAEQLGSGRGGNDTSSSLVTNSTEYRTFQEDFGGPTMDIYMELSKRDELIAKLTDSLQQSLNVRENLQTESEKLGTEVQLLRRQLTEAMDTLRRPYWPRADQESNGGQRISEISMDLISESDDDLERQFLTDNEDKYSSRNSRERQLSQPRQLEGGADGFDANAAAGDWAAQQSTPAFSKQIEQFKRYLTPNEVRLFFMVQKKFDEFLSQELEKARMKCEHELKQTVDQMENEKSERETEIKRLLLQRQEKDSSHEKEMEDLRKYFESKCAELEKQYSDDVFSQKSQRHGADSSSSECSDHDQMPEELISPLAAAAVLHATTATRSKETSPRKRSRAELLLSPSHRQMTPYTEGASEEDNKHANLTLEIAEMKTFYQQKIHELQRAHEQSLRKLSEQVKYYESRYPEDDFMLTTNTTAAKDDGAAADTAPQDALATQVRDQNTSLIIIDQDELNLNNESQVIQKIIEEYERRLQEQLTLAREDIVHELEQQIHTLLSETTADDHKWPPELILLREQFTANSQLQIAQLQIKHEEEMSRLKQDYEKQLNRKNKRHSTFDSARDLDIIISERDGLRELSKSFRHVLAELAKCVTHCESELNATLIDEVQRLLASNRTLEESTTTASHDTDLTLNLGASLLNASLNASGRHGRLVPDVQQLLELVEDPSLLDFMSQKSSNSASAPTLADEFDLNECLARLRGEAEYLLALTEGGARQRPRLSNASSAGSGAEKHDEEAEHAQKQTTPPLRKFTRAQSLNEAQLPSAHPHDAAAQPQLSSLPPNLNRSFTSSSSELNFQVHELKNRLIKSESDRYKLQQELDHTITRNSELGQELQQLRTQLSQLSSLNHCDYAEGYGLASLKSPERVCTDAEKSATALAQLQERARNLLSTPTGGGVAQPQKLQQECENNANSTVLLLEMIEDFCREGDKVVECSRKDREDLQSQIDTADKRLKATRLLLEDQAAEREQERDEFAREIERLKGQLRDKEKERNSYANASAEVIQLESQLRELTQQLGDSNAKRDKFEVELKASIDKIFEQREIMLELENQVDTKALNERVLGENIKQLEEFINSQSLTNETLQNELQSLKSEISEGYQPRMRQLEEKLQNVRPSAEQSMVMDEVVEQLRVIEATLESKTKTLESLHYSNASNSCSSLSATEDISVHGSLPAGAHTAAAVLIAPTLLSAQGSPMHPSPRQHSYTMEGVQRIAEKLARHSRVEEAAIKRIRDLEMQVTQMRGACVELQQDRDSLQERMSEQSQRISSLQSRLEEQRQRAEMLQRAGTGEFNIRITDLQTEVQNLHESLSSRDKQIAIMKQQLEKSKQAIDQLEAELAAEPDHSNVDRLEAELREKSGEIQKLREKIKSEMINKLALPDLMETMLADKNEEIDHLKEQLESKEKELQSALELGNISGNSSGAAGGASKAAGGDASTKMSARTLSDIVSISEFDEPDVVRRAAAAHNLDTPLLMPPEGSGGFLHQTMETSKEAMANLTHKRTDDLSGFAAPLQPTNTFDHPHYFQDPHALVGSAKSGATITPIFVPRQIDFSAMTEDSKLTHFQQTPEIRAHGGVEEKLAAQVEELKRMYDNLGADKEQEVRVLEEDLIATQLRLGGLQEELEQRRQEIVELQSEAEHYNELKSALTEKNAEIEELESTRDRLNRENRQKTEELTKSEKNLINLQETAEKQRQRIRQLEEQTLTATKNEVQERESLRKELRALGETHEQCKFTLRDAETRKQQIELLNQEIKAKDERLLQLSTKLSQAEQRVEALQPQIANLQREIEQLRQQQQQNSEHSSRQFSVDDIAQQVDKELNYSAQLDSNILRAIESEEENNLDSKVEPKETQTKTELNGTDDENFIGERELLNQLEALRTQIAVEREQSEEIKQELHAEQQHSQEIQEQDVVIIEAMRMRLEKALSDEDELHKQLELEQERCARLQTQLTAQQRAESRRNSSALLKSPTDSPRKSPRSPDSEAELAERLRSEIKLLAAQNERERERCADVGRSAERERQRYATELQERVEYCERLKRQMEQVARDKDHAEQESEHLRERLTLQTQEIECLETRLATLQEAETRRTTRRDRQQQETAQQSLELHELRTQLAAAESHGESLAKQVGHLRFDVERSAAREARLAEALERANSAADEASSSVPQQFLQKMKEINALLAENTQENRQMAETVQFLVEERRQLQCKCEELETRLGSTANVSELEERCNHLLGRYLRVESHRKALVYQKRYLKISLQGYQQSEQRALANMQGQLQAPPREKKRMFKTVALAIIAIQRMKYIGRIWHTGKRIVSKSVFTITQQKRCQPPTISCAANSSSSPTTTTTQTTHISKNNHNNHSPFRLTAAEQRPLQSPALLSDLSAATTSAAAVRFN